jgi:branched-chain amino acid transport system permease protein
MPSANLLLQSLAAGVFIGALYGLIGLGLSLGWGLLKQINLAHFAWVFLSAYLTYELKARLDLDPLISLLILIPCFVVIAISVQWLLASFAITPFNSLMATFGLSVSVEALIQLFWSADFRRMPSQYEDLKFHIGGVIVTYSEAITMLIALFASFGVWWVLSKTDTGKSVRASAEDAEMARAFGINASKLSLGLAGVCGALAACAGASVALTFTLAPSQIFAWIGVIFAVVMMGKLASPWAPLVAGLVIGISESMTMAITAPSWAPLVSFSLLIVILLMRRSHG